MDFHKLFQKGRKFIRTSTNSTFKISFCTTCGRVYLGMQLPIIGLIAYLHAQFRKAQLKFSSRLSNTNSRHWNWHFEEHQAAKTPDLLFISTGRELTFFLSKLKVWFKKIKGKRQGYKGIHSPSALSRIDSCLPWKEL